MNLLCSVLFIVASFQNILCGVNPKVDSITGVPINFNPRCTERYDRTETPELVISTPNFPNNYDNNLACGWTIESIEDAADISVNFLYFNIEMSKRCSKYDYVMLYKQGNGQSDWDQIGYLEGYCGEQDPFTVSATTKRIFIKFISDDSRSFPGFNLTFDMLATQASPKIVCLGAEGDQTCNNTVYAEERQMLTISCNAKAIPPATYEWRLVVNETYDTQLRSEFVKTQFPNGSLQIQNLKLSDQGYYRCIATNKFGINSQNLYLVVAEKCLCKKQISVGWFPNPPYTKYMRNKKVMGVFYHILTDIIKNVCGNCEKGYGYSELLWLDGSNNRINRGVSEVKVDIEANKYDIYLPIEGSQTDDRYRNVYYFLPIVPSPGIALFAIGPEEGAAAMSVFSSIMGGWPMFVLTVVMAVLAGIIVWILDTYWNEAQFPRNFKAGIIEGFWWAFVSMTTVGYGDIAPVGVPARLFAVIWILTGLVLIAIFTGIITTALTVSSFSTSLALYGSTIGALNNSIEFRLGVNRNAKMENYFTYDEIYAAMDSRQVDGCLIDSYVAAYYKELFSSFRVNNIISSNKAYGIVLGKDMSKDGIPELMHLYVQSQKALITKMITDNVDTLEASASSAAEESSASLFDPKSSLFLKAITGSCALLLIISLGGLLFEYGYLKPRYRMIEAAKNLEMVESKDIKEMALRAKLLKEVLLQEVQDFYDRWAERFSNLTKKHKAEQKKLLAHGRELASQSQNRHMEIVEDPIEIDGTDIIDKPHTPRSTHFSAGSQHTLVNNEHEESTEL